MSETPEEKELKKKQFIDDSNAKRIKNEKLELARDLGIIAARHKKQVSDNPYVSHEIEEEGKEKSEPTIKDLQSESWIAGYNSFKGSVK